jgi:hypothetical protein
MRMSRTILLVIVILAAGTYVALRANAVPDTLVLETAHLAVLPPHEHDDGDAVSDDGHHQYLLSEVYVAPRDLWVSGFTFDMVNAPDTSVHHVSLLDYDRPHQTCRSLPFSQLLIFAQDVMHNATTTFPTGAAMHIRKGEHVQLSLMIHNPEPPLGPGDTYRDVYGKLTLSLVPPAQEHDLKEVKFHLAHLDDAPCVIREPDQSDAYVFAVPARTQRYVFSGSRQDTDPSRFVFTKPSTIVFIGAHLHGWQGGKELLVQKNGAPFLSFKTALSKDDPFRYDTPYYATSAPMAAGDALSLTAIYQNPHAVPTRGAMGDLGFYYYEQ